MIKNIFKFLVLSVAAFTSAQFVYAQTASILPPAKTTFFDSNGKPLANGKIDFYIPGTTTRKLTWQDSGETIPNTNPVVLDSAGRAIILGDGSYRQRVTDKNGNLIWDQVTSSTGSGGGGGGSATVGDGDAVGTVKAWAGLSAPYGYVFAYGQEFTRASYPELFAAITSQQNVSCTTGSPTLTGVGDTSQLPIGANVESSCLNTGATIVSKTVSTITASSNAIISTTTSARFFPFGNGDGDLTFNLPDLRGRVIAGNDVMGGIAANRLPSPYNSLGGAGGVSNQTISQANLPSVNFNVTIPAGQGSHSHSVSNTMIPTSDGLQTGSQTILYNPGPTTSNSATLPAMSGTAASGGSASPLSVVQPTQAYNYIIKVLPDTNPNSYFGVASIGGMFGVIDCGVGLTCAGNTISATASLPFITTGSTSIQNGNVNGILYKDNSGLLATSNSLGSGVVVTNGSGVPLVSNSNVLYNGLLTQANGATIKGNPTSALANVQDFTIQGLNNLPSPNPTLDYLPIYDHSTGTIKNVTPQSIANASVAGVASIGGMTGVIACGNNITCTSNKINAKTPPNNIIYLVDYGYVADGITDNTTAINNAVIAAKAAGGYTTIMAPVGVGNVGNVLTIDATGIWFKCAGAPGTCIFNATATSAMFTFGSSTPAYENGFSGIGFSGNSSPSQIMIYYVNGSELYLYDCMLVSGVSTLLTLGDGVTNNVYDIHIERLSGKVPNVSAPLIHPISGGGLFINNSFIYNQSEIGEAASGRTIISVYGTWNTISARSNFFYLFDNALLADIQNGKNLGDVHLQGNYFDEMGTTIKLIAESGGSIGNVSLTDLEGTGKTGSCISISGTGTFLRIDMINLILRECKNHGILVSSPILLGKIQNNTITQAAEPTYFQASISGNIMTVTAMQLPYGRYIAVGDNISGLGVAAGTTVTALGTGTGQLGTYILNNSQTISSQQMAAQVTQMSSLYMAPGSNNITISGNSFGNGSSNMGAGGGDYGVTILGGVNLNISSNMALGAVSNWAISGTYTNSIMASNNNLPVTTSVISVGASPFTHTSGMRPETTCVFGGTVTGITVNGQGITGASSGCFNLGSNGNISVSYSSSPNMYATIQ